MSALEDLTAAIKENTKAQLAVVEGMKAAGGGTANPSSVPSVNGNGGTTTPPPNPESTGQTAPPEPKETAKTANPNKTSVRGAFGAFLKNPDPDIQKRLMACARKLTDSIGVAKMGDVETDNTEFWTRAAKFYNDLSAAFGSGGIEAAEAVPVPPVETSNTQTPPPQPDDVV